jgi:formylglycine-generating enzyme required for sulfatase activity
MYSSMADPATVSSFRLDKYKVTVGRFRRFVESGHGTQVMPPVAGDGEHRTSRGSGWQDSFSALLPVNTSALLAALACVPQATWTDTAGVNEHRPVNCITWFEAFAFCAWDGGYLPTETEWNFAAAGGGEQRAYPWSSPAGDITISSQYASYLDNGCVGDGDPACTVADLPPVGTKPLNRGRYGHADLAGAAWEWTLDKFTTGYLNPCNNCIGVTGENPVIRGGGFDSSATFLRTGQRFANTAATGRSGAISIRCARPE